MAIASIVGPVGEFQIIEVCNPSTTETSPITEEIIAICIGVDDNFLEAAAGIIRSPVISNIQTILIEIENTLSKHPSVSIAAVVAKPDEKWGEVPCAFIEAVKDKPVSEKELIDFCKETLAGFQVPKKVVFCELPKTSTGKIQKFELRKQV